MQDVVGPFCTDMSINHFEAEAADKALDAQVMTFHCLTGKVPEIKKNYYDLASLSKTEKIMFI